MLLRARTFAALAIAACFALPLHARVAHAQSADTQRVNATVPAAPVPSDTTAASAAVERERAFVELEREFIPLWSRHRESLERVKRGEIAATDALPPPQSKFYGRFDALARAGHPRALRWCIQFAPSCGLSAADVLQVKRVNYRALVGEFANEPWIGEVLRELRQE